MRKILLSVFSMLMLAIPALADKYEFVYDKNKMVVDQANNKTSGTLTLDAIVWDYSSTVAIPVTKEGSWKGVGFGNSNAKNSATVVLSNSTVFKNKKITNVSLGVGCKNEGAKYAVKVDGNSFTSGDINSGTNTEAKKQTVTWNGEVICAETLAIEITTAAAVQNFLGPITIVYENADSNMSDMPTIEGDATFAEKMSVTITAAEGAAIYYTLNGDDPTAESTKYTEPFEITETTTVKAIAIEAEKTASEVAEKTFTKTGYASIINLLDANPLNLTATLTGKVVVTAVYQNASGNGYNMYVKDETAPFYFYSGTAFPDDYVAGAEITGIQFKFAPYKGVNQGTFATGYEFPAATEGAAPAPETATGIATATANSYVEFVRVKGDEIKTTVNPINKFADCTMPEWDAEKYYDIRGIVTLSSNAPALYYISSKENVEAGVAEIEAAIEGEAVYYNLQGVRVVEPENGVYVRVKGNKAEKVVIR